MKVMNKFEMLKKRARQNPIGAKYLDSLSSGFGKEIFQMRMRNRLTQSELAKISSTTQKTISRIEAGDPGVKIGTYEKVLNALKEYSFRQQEGTRELLETVES